MAHEAEVFAALYIAAVCSAALLESFFPRRRLAAPMGRRWATNIGLTLMDVGLVRLVFPFIGFGAALWAESQHLGLLRLVPLPEPIAGVLAVALLDLGRYLEHRLLHRVPLLWRLHLVHHTDPDYDFSTGLRFHPAEAVFSAAFDLGVIVLLGAPPAAVALYGFVVVVWVIFVHANVHLPQALDAALRPVLVTPDLHRTHHSAAMSESMTNFGGVTPLWDRLFRTYRGGPALGHERMRLGVEGYPAEGAVRLRETLAVPFRAMP